VRKVFNQVGPSGVNFVPAFELRFVLLLRNAHLGADGRTVSWQSGVGLKHMLTDLNWSLRDEGGFASFILLQATF
jgi:hypothetical protein